MGLEVRGTSRARDPRGAPDSKFGSSAHAILDTLRTGLAIGFIKDCPNGPLNKLRLLHGAKVQEGLGTGRALPCTASARFKFSRTVPVRMKRLGPGSRSRNDEPGGHWHATMILIHDDTTDSESTPKHLNRVTGGATLPPSPI
jgi:hypothetical protein